MSLTHDAPGVFPDGPYPDESPETVLEYGYEPTDEDWAEYREWSEALDDAGPTPDDRGWWADQQDTRDAREAAEDAIDRADREQAEVDRLRRERAYDVTERRGVGPGHAMEGGM